MRINPEVGHGRLSRPQHCVLSLSEEPQARKSYQYTSQYPVVRCPHQLLRKVSTHLVLLEVDRAKGDRAWLSRPGMERRVEKQKPIQRPWGGRRWHLPHCVTTAGAQRVTVGRLSHYKKEWMVHIRTHLHFRSFSWQWSTE